MITTIVFAWLLACFVALAAWHCFLTNEDQDQD